MSAAAVRGRIVLALGALLGLCSLAAAQGQEGGASAGLNANPNLNPTPNAFSRPVAGMNDADWARFQQGRNLFNQSWSVAGVGNEQLDGLGPVYNRLACVSCHGRNGRGRPPEGEGERMLSMLLRLSVPGQGAHGGPRPHPAYGEQLNEEGVAGVPGEGRGVLRWVAVAHRQVDGQRVLLRRPMIHFEALNYGPLGRVLVSPRVGQMLVGMGWLDGVPDQTLYALAAQPKPDRVRGRVNLVWDPERQARVPGRFGHKANMPSLKAQVAGAFVGDLGITSPLFPQENCAPAQAACRAAPSGGTPELEAAQLEAVVFYLSRLELPPRRGQDQPQVQEGETVFGRLGCAVCHVPSLGSQRDGQVHPVAAYTDLLLHDMGPGLADGRPDFSASGRAWRTAPLWGLGLTAVVSEQERYLHDGRACSLTEAILWHGGEASVARRRFERLPVAQRLRVLAFLRSL